MTSTTSRILLKSVLIDLSGTLHVENSAIPGAVEALKRLRQTNLKIKFVTNTTKESRRFLHGRLRNLGFELEAEEIFSSLSAAHDLISKRQLRPMLMIDDAAMEDFTDVVPDEGTCLDAVVIGLAPERFNYEELTKAFRLLTSGAQLIAIHEARYFKRSDGLALGPGAFVKGLEYAADCKSHVVGKPSPEFFCAALGGEEPGAAVMIGDDVRDDIGGAQALGIQGFLVQTGKYRPGDEQKISPPPCHTCPSFADAVDIILKLISNERNVR